MRTTLNIDEDVLQAAKELALKQKRTAGEVLSELARKGLRAVGEVSGGSKQLRNGVEILASRGETVTLERVEDLMDEEGI